MADLDLGMPSMGVLEGIFEFISSGTIFGLPTFVVMLFPLIAGLIVGFLARKFLKIAIIATVVILIAAYLGFFGLNLTTLKSLAEEFGPIAIQYGTLNHRHTPVRHRLLCGSHNRVLCR